MTAAPGQPEQPTPRQRRRDADPESFRMTIGEHLEELRVRVIHGLIGFIVAAFVCMCFGKMIVRFFCRPLFNAFAHNHLNPQIMFSGIEDVFAVYIKISLITGAAFAGPWLIYQLWKFVAAGLYPHERKYVTKYVPVSITLLIVGMVFMYMFVLPITLNFFLNFNLGSARDFEIPSDSAAPAATMPATQPSRIPILRAEPPHPAEGDMWINAAKRQIRCYFQGDVRVITFGADTLTTPMIMLDKYIDMVVNLLLSFGVAFQLPLVILALVRIGIVEIATLKRGRKYVVFIMSVVAAFIIPDVVTGMLALMVPLIGLYELGILMAGWGQKKQANAGAAS